MSETEHRRPLVRRVGGVAVPFAALRLVGQGAEFVAFIVFARTLGAADLGRVWAALLVARYLGLAADWGADLGGARTVARQDWPVVRALVRRRQLVTPILFLAYVAGARGIAWWLWPVGVVVLTRGLNRDWIALGEERGVRSAVPSVVQGVTLVVAALAVHGNRGDAAAAIALGYGAGLLVSLLLNRVSEGEHAPLRTEGWLLVGSLADQVSLTADVLLISWFRSARDAGVYAAAYRIPNAWNTAVGLAVNGMVPAVSATLQDRADLLAYVRRRLLRTSCAVGVALAAAAPLISLLVVPIFGSDFQSGRLPAWILLTSMAVATAGAPLHALYLACGTDRGYALTLVLGAAVNLSANLVLIPLAGPAGAATANLISVSALVTTLYLLTRRAERMPEVHEHALTPSA
jgi:O-antigen/teichoic acid export membrane protein